MNNYKPDYASLSDLLGGMACIYSPAECQGIMLGMQCAGVDDWRSVLLASDAQPELADDEGVTALQAMWDFTRQELQQQRVPLTLMLPDEDYPAVEQATAIRDWCQGYLYGFGLSGKRAEDLLETEAGEALHDMSQIAQLDTTEVEGQDNENALQELREYLWVAAVLIWHEMNDQ